MFDRKAGAVGQPSPSLPGAYRTPKCLANLNALCRCSEKCMPHLGLPMSMRLNGWPQGQEGWRLKHEKARLAGFS